MGTFFEKVEAFESIPKLHEKYAESLLSLLIGAVLDLDEIDVGVIGEN